MRSVNSGAQTWLILVRQWKAEILLPLGQSYENRKGMYRVSRIKNIELIDVAERLAKDQFLPDVFDVALLL